MDMDLGVKQRPRKHVRVNVPQAFTGDEAVQWLLQHMHLDDSSKRKEKNTEKKPFPFSRSSAHGQHAHAARLSLPGY